MNCRMVLNNTNKNNSILFEVFASVFTVSSYFTDNPRKFIPRFFHTSLTSLWWSHAPGGRMGSKFWPWRFYHIWLCCRGGHLCFTNTCLVDVRLVMFAELHNLYHYDLFLFNLRFEFCFSTRCNCKCSAIFWQHFWFCQRWNHAKIRMHHIEIWFSN